MPWISRQALDRMLDRIRKLEEWIEGRGVSGEEWVHKGGLHAEIKALRLRIERIELKAKWPTRASWSREWRRLSEKIERGDTEYHPLTHSQLFRSEVDPTSTTQEKALCQLREEGNKLGYLAPIDRPKPKRKPVPRRPRKAKRSRG